METFFDGNRGKSEEHSITNMLQQAHEFGVTLFDTADADGEGWAENLLGNSLKSKRHDIIIATKFGYDFYNYYPNHESIKGSPHNWSPEFVRYACEQSLRRIGSDYIDLYQLHHPDLLAIESDELFELLEKLVAEGKLRSYGISPAATLIPQHEIPAIVAERDIATLSTIYNILTRQYSDNILKAAQQNQVAILAREPHANGRLRQHLSPDGLLPSTSRNRLAEPSWNPDQIRQLKDLGKHIEETIGTIDQVAIKWALTNDIVASVLPNIYSNEDLWDFCKASDLADLTELELEQISELYTSIVPTNPCNDEQI